MRFFGGRGGNADDNNHTNNSTGPSGNGNGNGHAAAHQPLLDRPNRLNRQISNISGVSYGSVVSRTTGPTGTGVPDGLTAPADGAPNGTANGHRRRSRSRSKRRRQKIRTSIYAEPPGESPVLIFILLFSLVEFGFSIFASWCLASLPSIKLYFPPRMLMIFPL